LKPLYLLIFIAWMTTAFCCFSAETLTNEQQLAYADKLKDNNPTEFSQALQNISVELLSPIALETYQYLVAYSQFQNNDTDEAIDALDKLSSQAISSIKYRAMITLVDVYSLTKNWNDGISSARILSEEIETISDKTFLNPAYISLILFFNKVGDFDAAVSYAQKLLNNTSSSTYTCLGKANRLIAKIQKQYQIVSKAQIVDGLKSCHGAENIVWKNTINIHYGKILLKENRIKAAIVQLGETLPMLEKTGNTELIAQFYAQLGKAYLALNDYSNANLFASKSVSIYGANKDQESLLAAFETLYQVAQHNNNLHQALIFHKSYFAASQAYLQSIRSRQLAIDKNQITSVENQTTLSLLDQENVLLKTQAKLAQKTQENNQLELALAISLILLLIFWSYRSRRSQTKLRHLANSDELTGIATRNYFRHVSNIALQQSKAVKSNTCLILFDLDNFKRVNDKFGHLAGDQALKSSVEAVKGVCRANDLIARMGCEEFAILVQKCTLLEARKIAEECRQSLQNLTFTSEYPDLQITASFGVADTQECGYNYEKIFARADAALFRAKAFGRNNVYLSKDAQLNR
jgi:diguanylate cyclase (GGDEF)-like protein